VSLVVATTRMPPVASSALAAPADSIREAPRSTAAAPEAALRIALARALVVDILLLHLFTLLADQGAIFTIWSHHMHRACRLGALRCRFLVGKEGLPIDAALVGMCHPDQQVVPEVGRHELQAHRQAVDLAAGNAESRVPGEVEGA